MAQFAAQLQIQLHTQTQWDTLNNSNGKQTAKNALALSCIHLFEQSCIPNVFDDDDSHRPQPSTYNVGIVVWIVNSNFSEAFSLISLSAAE